MAGNGIVVRADGEGEKRWFYGGGLHTWKATAEETNGSFLLFEDHMGPGKMTPVHVHPHADEAFYVKCDRETNPAEGIDLGQVVCEVGIAPVKPAEFVIFRRAK